MNHSWETIIHWNLPYSEYLNILDAKKNILKNESDKRFLLICSHPHCFTHGRGLRELHKQNDLIHFDSTLEKKLPYPLFNINRGGGLTFHYPGQIIIYPLVNLNSFPKALMTLMQWLLTIAGETSKELQFIDDFEINRNIYGLWSQHKKIASIGMGLDHYVTEHGLALNFFHDSSMFQVLETLYPCGIAPSTYTSIQHLHSGLRTEDRKLWLDLFLKKFYEKFP